MERLVRALRLAGTVRRAGRRRGHVERLQRYKDARTSTTTFTGTNAGISQRRLQHGQDQIVHAIGWRPSIDSKRPRSGRLRLQIAGDLVDVAVRKAAMSMFAFALLLVIAAAR